MQPFDLHCVCGCVAVGSALLSNDDAKYAHKYCVELRE